MSSSHVKIGFLAFCLALVLGLPAWWVARESKPTTHTVDIALVHDQPVTLSLVRLTATGGSIVEVSHSGPGLATLYLPSTWRRQEVRNAPLSSVVSDLVDPQTTRWTFPPGATVRFDAGNVGRIIFHNPSAVPVTVKTTTIRSGPFTREEDAAIITSEPYTLP